MIPKDSTVGADTERTLHRLEAFSDIVIGFCIAEMGLNLLVPQHASDIRTIKTGTIGFAVSFVLISLVWWGHQRIFRTFFMLTPVTVVLNFTLLGSLVLMVYFQQIALHFIGIGGDPADAVRLWLLSYGVVYGLLGAMLWTGVRARWTMLTEADLRWGVGRATILVIGAALFFVSAACYAEFPGKAVFGIAIGTVLFLRLFIPRMADRVVAVRAEQG
jgi:Endosomal/lysosomal potassium channel TMEM175